jgi:hypothetical protein
VHDSVVLAELIPGKQLVISANNFSKTVFVSKFIKELPAANRT